MDFGFLGSNNNHIPWLSQKVKTTTTISALPPETPPPPKEEQQRSNLEVKLFGRSLLLPLVLWVSNFQTPSLINKELKKKPVVMHNRVDHSRIRFRPYVSKVPWHTGPRAFLSQLFPRYGHYCGPNWSSGKEGGSPVWDRRPIDWLDFCCYCHDIGYDSHDQADMLKADLAFLDCLEKPNMIVKGDARIANLYKKMCTSGLRSILIPYRRHLLKLQSVQMEFGFGFGFGWLGDRQWNVWKLRKNP
ncbi:uncharacterized protein LOC124925985 [Impatiens glandulifera]|uniref:uncharacterized protein LOC124925985 n=1 Tax=Impatiens glandulifera TaxID=253017 RepID=UPI001FB174F5|nr:uncharacterized protein LOC124925985 [Impatiens glandulifera]